MADKKIKVTSVRPISEGVHNHHHVVGVSNYNKKGCGHDHSYDHEHHKWCSHGHHHDHHHHHHDHDPISYNHGILKKTMVFAGAQPDGFLERHRSKIVLAAAGTLAAIEYHTTSTSVAGTLAMIFASTAIAHDASEDLMESTGKLKETHNISSGVVGMGGGLAHTMSEGFLSASAHISGYEDVAISTTMGSNVSHIPLMAGMAGVIGMEMTKPRIASGRRLNCLMNILMYLLWSFRAVLVSEAPIHNFLSSFQVLYKDI